MTKDKTIITSVTLPRSLRDRLAREAKLTDRSQSAIVRLALREYFEKRATRPLPEGLVTP